MNGIIRFVKRLFGYYEPGHEYWINRSKIKIHPEYRKHRIGKDKFCRKIRYWYRTGEFESKIILNQDFVLVDGYSSFKIAEIKMIDKVPVYFVA